MSTANATPAQIAQINAVAKQYGLSPTTLLGVFGAESAYGTNLGPSSAGARGPFQFLPSTGTEYGLNSTSIEEFTPSLVAAAKYLQSLGANANPESKQTFAALNGYNGNKSGSSPSGYTNSVLSYGLSPAAFEALEKKAEAAGISGTINIPQDANNGVNAITGAASSAANAVASVPKAIGWVFSNWLRVLEFIGALILGIAGLVLLGRSVREPA